MADSKGVKFAANFEVHDADQSQVEAQRTSQSMEARASRRASRRSMRISQAARRSTVTSLAVSFSDVILDEVEDILLAPPPSATFASTCFTLLKNVLGSSVLSLPDGFKYASILPSFIICFIVVIMTISTMTVVAVLCHKYEATSYRGLWSQVVGPRTAPMVDVCICLNSIFSCVSYCLLIGSWMTQGLKELLGDLFGNVTLNSLIVAVFVLFPLTLLRDLHALRHTSVAGVACMLFGVGFMVCQAALHWDERIPGRTCGSHSVVHFDPTEKRSWVACTSSEVWSGGFYNPSFKMLETINMVAATFMAHYNVPKFYAEFYTRDPYVFGRATFCAMALGLVLAASLSLAGLLRFGLTMPDANILQHFNEQFPGGQVAIMGNTERLFTLFTWCVMSLNLVTSFPLLFTPLRTSFLQLCGTSVEALSPYSYIAITASLLSFAVVFGLIVPSLTLISKFKGAICGMSIAYIIPAMLMWKDSKGSRSLPVVCAVLGVLIMGSSLMVYGLSGAIKSLMI